MGFGKGLTLFVRHYQITLSRQEMGFNRDPTFLAHDNTFATFIYVFVFQPGYAAMQDTAQIHIQTTASQDTARLKHARRQGNV